MQFSDKLNYLMNITHTTNKELAIGISVDRSLISLLRNGRRKLPRNMNHIHNMAVYFAHRSSAAYQRHALAEMLEQPSIHSSMPVEVLTDQIEKWLISDSDFVDQIIEEIRAVPVNLPPQEAPPSVPMNEYQTSFFYDIEGHRLAMRQMMNTIRNISSPCSIFIASDINLEWLLDDYNFANEMQENLREILQKGFFMHIIMPSVNYMNRYVESLKFWFPVYVTGQVKVYYYPRLRDNLYRHSTIILPEHCVQSTTGVGLNNHNHISMLSTDPKLVKAYYNQFEEYLALCRPALDAHTNIADFIPCFQTLFNLRGNSFQQTTPLSLNTLPKELLELFIQQTDNIPWKMTYQMYLEYIPEFESSLAQYTMLDISFLATAEEVRSGKVYVGSVFQSEPPIPCYTPETYVLHLKNILRLMDTYDRYFFLPFHNKLQSEYNLLVKENGMALLMRTAYPPLMMEIHRPEMIFSFREHLLRTAEYKGYNGIYRTKIRSEIVSLIKELQE